jgi:hypothetical protein
MATLPTPCPECSTQLQKEAPLLFLLLVLYVATNTIIVGDSFEAI